MWGYLDKYIRIATWHPQTKISGSVPGYGWWVCAVGGRFVVVVVWAVGVGGFVVVVVWVMGVDGEFVVVVVWMGDLWRR